MLPIGLCERKILKNVHILRMFYEHVGLESSLILVLIVRKSVPECRSWRTSCHTLTSELCPFKWTLKTVQPVGLFLYEWARRCDFLKGLAHSVAFLT